MGNGPEKKMLEDTLRGVASGDIGPEDSVLKAVRERTGHTYDDLRRILDGGEVVEVPPIGDDVDDELLDDLLMDDYLEEEPCPNGDCASCCGAFEGCTPRREDWWDDEEDLELLAEELEMDVD